MPTFVAPPGVSSMAGEPLDAGTPGFDPTLLVPASGTGVEGSVELGRPNTGLDNVDSLWLGDPLELVASSGIVPYAIGPNAYHIQGEGFLLRSTLGNSVAVGTNPGKLCLRGNLAEVPRAPDGSSDYSEYWGVEVGFNLNEAQGNSQTSLQLRGDGDAAPASAPLPWNPGKVVGFSFVIEGPTIHFMRFKSLPASVDPSPDSDMYCKEVYATSGSANSVLLNELIYDCWNGTGSLLPVGGGLASISWELVADVAPAGARPFDWCLRDIRPILSPQ